MSLTPRILIALPDAQAEQVNQAVAGQFPSAVVLTAGLNELLAALTEEHFQLLFLDSSQTRLQDLKTLVHDIAAAFADLLVIPVIPEERQEQLLPAIESEVFYYITSPINQTQLLFVLKRAAARLASRAGSGRSTSVRGSRFPGFIGRCRPMQQLFDLIDRVADDDFATVLIRGESGTGKELVAKAIHSRSKRCNNNFVPVNCAAIPDELLESELFGHLKGSFTGALQTKQGRIQYANGGTLFLDEIGDMKPALQAKLLRVLQEKEFEPVGSLKATPVDTRIVAATHCDLEQLVKNGTFREDLYYRLSVIPMHVPPLRERPDDIPLLLNEFIEAYTSRRSREKIHFTPQAVALLMSYEWRGNVRELENLVQHMSILYSGRQIQPQDLPEKYTRDVDLERLPAMPPPLEQHRFPFEDCRRERAELLAPAPASSLAPVDLGNGPINFNELINEFETDLIVRAMKITSGNKKEAAHLLSLKRTTLLEKIKKKGLTGLWEE